MVFISGKYPQELRGHPFVQMPKTWETSQELRGHTFVQMPML